MRRINLLPGRHRCQSREGANVASSLLVFREQSGVSFSRTLNFESTPQVGRRDGMKSALGMVNSLAMQKRLRDAHSVSVLAYPPWFGSDLGCDQAPLRGQQP